MKKTSPAYILGFMIIICTVFGAAISFVHYVTLDMLEKNERLHKNRMICRAFRLPVAGVSADAYQKAIDAAISYQQLTHRGRVWQIYTRKDTGEIGFVFSGQGVWDRITGILVLSSDLSKIANIQFLEHKETPGLGGRIEEAWFTDQFQRVIIAWEQPVDKRIIVGVARDPKAKNRVDAVTGATQTSMAVMKFLNSELEAFKQAIKAWREERILLSGLPKGKLSREKLRALDFVSAGSFGQVRNFSFLKALCEDKDVLWLTHQSRSF